MGEEGGLGGVQTLGLGAGHGRVIDREIQRESLLCPDYLKAAREERVGEERDLGEGEESVKRKRRKGEHSTDAAAERVDCEEGEGEVKKSKKRKKHKRECSPAPADEQPELAHTAENIEDPEPLVKKKKKSRKEKDLVQVVAGYHNGGEQEDLSKNKEELTA